MKHTPTIQPDTRSTQYHDRADSLCKSAEAMKGTSGVVAMRLRAREARHVAMAAGLKGRGV